jgi:hypothetical protein
MSGAASGRGGPAGGFDGFWAGRGGGYRAGGAAWCWPGHEILAWPWARPALIVAAVLGFLLCWPVGLALLALAVCAKRSGLWEMGPAREGRPGGAGCGWRAGGRGSSGNRAFDEYRDETLRRLEEEQREFAAFLERLRFAKDKAEFDQFMAERRNPPPGADEAPQA